MNDASDLVRVYSGPLEIVESYAAMLSESNIQAKSVGTELTTGLGSALPDSIELWVHRSSLEKAKELIEKKMHHGHHQKFPHPTDQKIPQTPSRSKEHHVKQDPSTN